MSASVEEISRQWVTHFPALAQAHDPVIKRIMGSAKTFSFQANQEISTPGSSCDHYILLTTGSVRVQILTDTGREVVLYHVLPGNACILTTTCLLSGDSFPATSITDAPTEAIALTNTEFDLALQNSAQFRRFVFSNIGLRLVDVITRIEQLCSPAIDRHLATTLLKLSAGKDALISTTHQELASELGTAREVISRHLKRFELHGWVQLGRGTITIIAPDALTRLSIK